MHLRARNIVPSCNIMAAIFTRTGFTTLSKHFKPPEHRLHGNLKRLPVLSTTSLFIPCGPRSQLSASIPSSRCHHRVSYLVVTHGLLVIAGMLDCKLKPSIFQPVLHMRRRGR